MPELRSSQRRISRLVADSDFSDDDSPAAARAQRLRVSTARKAQSRKDFVDYAIPMNTGCRKKAATAAAAASASAAHQDDSDKDDVSGQRSVAPDASMLFGDATLVKTEHSWHADADADADDNEYIDGDHDHDHDHDSLDSAIQQATLTGQLAAPSTFKLPLPVPVAAAVAGALSTFGLHIAHTLLTEGGGKMQLVRAGRQEVFTTEELAAIFSWRV